MTAGQMTMIERLEACWQLVNDYRVLLKGALEAGGQTQDPPAQMLFRACAHADATLRAMSLLLPKELGTQAAALCRGFYELAVRVLWASREPDGWARLEAEEVQKVRKEVGHLEELPDSVAPRVEVVRLRNAVLKAADDSCKRADKADKPYKRSPRIQDMLRSIDKQDAANSEKQGRCNLHQAQYGLVYGLLCRSVHARISALTNDTADARARHATPVAILATLGLLRAICYVAPEGAEEEIEKIRAQIAPLLEGCRDAPVC